MKLDPLDILFSKVIRLKARKCQMCGRTDRQLNCAHYIGRRYRATRWEEDNAACLCVSCHWEVDEFSAIKESFFKKKIGSDRMEELQIQARSFVKPDKIKIKEELKKKLKKLEKELE